MKDRFTGMTWTPIPQPAPGHREVRFRPGRSHTDHRPKEGKMHV